MQLHAYFMQLVHKVMRWSDHLFSESLFLPMISRRHSVLYAVSAFPLAARAQVSAVVRVLAASDLKFALTDVVDQYQKQTGQSVQVNFGSSGQFARQVAQGLAADVLLSADEVYVQQLARAGHTQGEGSLYAVGRMAVLQPRRGVGTSKENVGSPLTDAGLRVLLGDLLATGRKFAIANPEHAPYGRAAREVLQHLGLWERALPRLVLGDNIAQATQFVTTGAAQAGLTALSMALAAPIAARTRHWLVPAHLHAPLRQRMVLLKNASAQAQGFFNYLQSTPVQSVLKSYGFEF